MSKRFLLTLILSGVTALELSGCGADADNDVKSNKGVTSLHDAAWTNSLDFTRLLIEHGADIEARDKFGRTALNMAAVENSHEVARLLIKHGANTSGIDLSWMK